MRNRAVPENPRDWNLDDLSFLLFSIVVMLQPNISGIIRRFSTDIGS